MRDYALSVAELQMARADAAGVALAGRRAEIAALRAMGRREASLGRIFEGHLNAAQLVARYGNPAQRKRLDDDLRAGRIFAVWNTQDEDGLYLDERDGTLVLRGAKSWTSGAGSIARALVTATRADGSLQMCLVPMERARVTIDASAWNPLGMEASDSFRVDFSGVALDAGALIGAGGDYPRQPWFSGGALRFLAVHAGIVERLAEESARYLVERERQGDPFQRERAARTRVAVRDCLLWLDAGVRAWEAFDAGESEAAAALVLETVDMARMAVERAANETIEATLRSVGARGLLEPLPFAALVRDLQMYLRQPAPDAAMLRVADAAFRQAAAARSTAVASSTGTSG
jgi:alkylation response protein AidB-like acyl-CoA dehydrogenase